MTTPTHTIGIDQLEPAPVWRFFAGLAAVPRRSKKEERVRAHMKRVAAELGLAAREDAAGNLVIEVPATPGYEHAPITVLQGHLDMVCEQNAGTKHDFDADPIRPIVETDPKTGAQYVRADGTTLGADNGIGVSLALAAASSPDVVHGPLELLCTIDEETGMTGAIALKPDFFKGRRLLNLDSEEDHVIYIGCAGGCDNTLAWEFKAAVPPAGAETCRVSVSGLRGGHSGGDIHLNRGNAIKLLVQTLRDTGETRLHLAEMKGGSVRNAIPREASALVVGPAGVANTLTKTAKEVQAAAVRSSGEAQGTIRVEKTTAPAAVIAATDTQRLLAALLALPSGVLAVVPEIAGLVQTSNNLSVVSTERGADGRSLRVLVGCLARSSSADQIQTTVCQIAAIGELGGAKVETGNAYPGWQPNVDSPTLATCRRVYEKLFGEAPNVTAIHAGLECGIIGERVGGHIDMVSFGPHITGAHSPDERVYVASVQKSWKYLTAVLAELARG